MHEGVRDTSRYSGPSATRSDELLIGIEVLKYLVFQ